MSASDSKDVVPDEAVLRELQLCDAQLTDVATEAAAKEYLMARDLLAARQATIAKIPHFWGVVFDAAYTELEAAVTPADRKLLGAVTSIEVVRPEIPAGAKASDSGLDKFGEPRSIAIRFTFGENEFLADSTLEKVFWYRYGKDGFAGLVSDPVKVNWKPGKDLTKGLTDAAYKLFAAQKGNAAQNLDGVFADKAARQVRDKAAKAMPEYKALEKLLEDEEEGAVSFFNFWSFRGRWTSAAESKEARAEALARRQKALAGAAVDEEEDEDDDDDEFPEESVETFPNGGEVAGALADDIWPNAIDYFLAPTIDSDFEDDDDEDDEDDDDVEMS